MKTTVYTCDKCKQSKSETDIISIDVSYKIAAPNKHPYTKRVQRDACKACIDRLGMLTERPVGDEADEKIGKSQKTFEDKFVELLSDLGVMFEE